MGLLMPSKHGRLPKGGREALDALAGRVLSKGARLRGVLNNLEKNVVKAKSPDSILEMLGDDLTHT